MRSVFRAYFYDRDGKEFSSHELNGREWESSGSAVNTDGELVCDHGGIKWTDKKGRIARTRMTVMVGSKIVEVTPELFETNAILVKWWAPGEIEWFWLIDQASCKKIAEQTAKHQGKGW